MDQLPRSASLSTTNADTARRQFMEKSLEGALALFSVWSTRPELAIEAFNIARRACIESVAQLAHGSELSGYMHQLACRLVARRSLALDAELQSSPRTTQIAQVWREALSDVFCLCCEPMAPAGRIKAAGEGPSWLLEIVLRRHPVDEETGLARARLFARGSSPQWTHALLCAPKQIHLFSVGPQLTRCLAFEGSTDDLQLDKAKGHIVGSFARAFAAPEHAVDALTLALRRRFWGRPDQAEASASSLRRIDDSPFAPMAALVAHCCAPPASLQGMDTSWISKCKPGSVSEADALFALLWAPGRSVVDAALFARQASCLTPSLLHAGLARLAGYSKDDRARLARLLLDWSQIPGLELNAPSIRVAKSGPQKLLCSNALELALRAAILNKATPNSDEGAALRSIMGLCIERGASMDKAGPDGGPSTHEKLTLNKSQEAQPWRAWAESCAIASAASGAAAEGPGRKYRL